MSTPGAPPTPTVPGAPTGEGFLAGVAGRHFGKTSRRGDSIAAMATKTAVRTVTNQVAGQITRGLLGSILGGRRR